MSVRTINFIFVTIVMLQVTGSLILDILDEDNKTVPIVKIIGTIACYTFAIIVFREWYSLYILTAGVLIVIHDLRLPNLQKDDPYDM